jgi:hypothetical protein
MKRKEGEDPQKAERNAVTPTYEKPETIPLGTVTKLTRNSNGGPFVDGSSDNNYRWRAG